MYIAVACLIMVGAIVGRPIAHADPQYDAEIVFTGINTDENGVTLSGTVTSTGTDPLYRVQVVLWRDRTPLNSRDQLDGALAADPDADTGDRIDTDDAATVVCSGTTSFDPGESADFTVTATWDEMDIHADGVYLVGVHVRAASVSWGSPVTIGRGRTLVTVANNTSASVATVVMLTSAPSLIHDDIFIDDHLADELAGRLGTLLDLAHQPGISWVVDPALIDEVSQMAKGYEVLAPAGPPDQTAPPSGATVPGTGSKQAAEWLNSFTTLNKGQGYRLPWGNPDLVFGASNGMDLVSPSQSTNLPMNDLQDLPLVVRSGNGEADDSFLTSIADLQPDIVLADAGTDAVLPHGVLLATLPVPFPGGPGPDADTPLQHQQRTLAEDATGTTIRVISTEDDAAQAAQPAPAWVTPVLLGAIQAQTDWTPDLSRGTPEGVLTAAELDGIEDVQSTAAAYASLISDTKSADAQTGPAMARLTSLSWAGDAPATAYSQAVDQWISSIMDGVSLTASTEVSLSSRKTPFPVTVVNKLDVPVSVRISAQAIPAGQSPANLTIPTTEVQTIQPGDKVPVILSPTVTREGDADVILTLTTGDGYILGSSATVRIHASSASWMAWLVVGTAVVLFIVGTFLRVRAKSRTKPAPDTDPTPPDVILTESGSPLDQTSTHNGDPDFRQDDNGRGQDDNGERRGDNRQRDNRRGEPHE